MAKDRVSDSEIQRRLNVCRRIKQGSWADRLAEAVTFLAPDDWLGDAALRLVDDYRASEARPQRYRIMGVLVVASPADSRTRASALTGCGAR